MKTILLVFFLAMPAFGNDLRIVEGKTYNVNQSTNWITLPKNPSCKLVVMLATTNGIFIKECRIDFNGEEIKARFLVKNLPNREMLVTGDQLEPMRVMMTGTVSDWVETLAVYDYGKPK